MVNTIVRLVRIINVLIEELQVDFYSQCQQWAVSQRSLRTITSDVSKIIVRIIAQSKIASRIHGKLLLTTWSLLGQRYKLFQLFVIKVIDNRKNEIKLERVDISHARITSI